MYRITALIMLCFAGCARYEYDILRPETLAMHVGRESDALAPLPPLEYRFRSVENRLVMRIYNTTDDAIQFVGERSFVVDPGGQSHPLRGQTIAPNSFIKLILPPYRPRLERTGPTFGIGVGTYVGDRRGRSYDDFYNPYYAEPRYFTVIEDDSLYWNWSGEGEIRLLLFYARGDETFAHEFVIRRVKA
jgi:hypothetical protein